MLILIELPLPPKKLVQLLIGCSPGNILKGIVMLNNTLAAINCFL